MKRVVGRLFLWASYVVAIFLAFGICVIWRSMNSPAGVFWAIKSGHDDLACWLVRHGVPVDTRNFEDETPLMKAAFAGDMIGAQCLIAHGADVNARSTENVTPLYYAVSGERDRVILLLLEKGAQVNKMTPGGGSVLLTAASDCRQDYVTWFLAAGAEVNARDRYGNSALSWACQGGGSLDLVAELVNKGADTNVVSEPGSMTPLMYAAQSCKPEVVRFLVEHGASLNQFNFDGYDALTIAAIQDRPDNIKELVGLGANINHRNKNGLTPLLAIAASAGRMKAIQSLIDCGADVRERTPDGMTAIQLAEFGHHWDVVEILTRHQTATQPVRVK